jgi:hypothetical protein
MIYTVYTVLDSEVEKDNIPTDPVFVQDEKGPMINDILDLEVWV